MIKPKIILTVGISNSGKSTWARNFINENPHFVDINRDDMRIAFFCDGDRGKYNEYRFSKHNEGLVTEIAQLRAEHAIKHGKGVIISDTNLNPKSRNYWKNLADVYDMDYEEKVFNAPLHVCLLRNQKRDITIPESALRRQHRNMREYLGLPKYEPNTDNPKAVIFDIDGTLAHMQGRSPFDWDRVLEDTVDSHVYELLNMYEFRGYDIIIMSGRDGSCVTDTAEWLRRMDIPYTELRMRTAGDNRADVIVKEELFWEIADMYNVCLAVDDRTQVVDMWRTLGIKCYQVAEGDF